MMQEVQPLKAVAIDPGGRVVYVDIQPGEAEGEPLLRAKLHALRERLLSVQPSLRVLERLQPINRGRILVEIEDEGALESFRVWFLTTVGSRSVGAPLRRLLAPLSDSKIRSSTCVGAEKMAVFAVFSGSGAGAPAGVWGGSPSGVRGGAPRRKFWRFCPQNVSL